MMIFFCNLNVNYMEKDVFIMIFKMFLNFNIMGDAIIGDTKMNIFFYIKKDYSDMRIVSMWVSIFFYIGFRRSTEKP